MSNIKRERIWSERYTAGIAEDRAAIGEIAKALESSEIFACLLWNRGYKTPLEAERFLRFETTDFHDPFLLNDMDIAVHRVMRAVENREKICIYGDYDVDGVTSVSLLYP